MKHLFTSESVTEGHPDKICDQISDSILDAILYQDPDARVACETVTATGLVLLTGEISTSATVDYTQIVRETLKNIGYTDPSLNFSDKSCSVLTAINCQSSDIAQGVGNALESRDTNDKTDKANTIGAGDQGLMFGYACTETPELMPFPIALSHKLALRLTEVRKQGVLEYLRPDGKIQVTVEYNNNCPVRLHTVVVSTQHSEETSLSQMKSDLYEYVIKPVIKKYSLPIDNQTKIIINPSGRFVIGGPHGDAGLTGRKVIVDTYGGYARHGGGAFSGKDATKVDRSGAYAARYIAKNIVAAGLAKTCEIQLSYAIGMAQPISVSVFSHGTGIVSDSELSDLVEKVCDLRPYAIIEKFQLKYLPQLSSDHKFYSKIAAYGHFGRDDIKLPWEELDLVSVFKDHMQNKKTSTNNISLESDLFVPSQ